MGLSGGQRARVALARSLYSAAANNNKNKIYLLDDILSSLDVNVSRIVYNRLKTRFNNENATVVFVTNDIPLVAKSSDKIIIMEKITTTSHSNSGSSSSSSSSSSCSTIKDIGTYEELIERGHDLYTIATKQQHHDDSDYDHDYEEEEEEEKDCNIYYKNNQ